jgi:hypothetical protein
MDVGWVFSLCRAVNFACPKSSNAGRFFKYVDGQATPQSKPFKTKEQAEWARLKLPERERRSVAVGVIRIVK